MSKRNQGILFILLAGMFFAMMTFFVRLAGDLPTMQKVLFRNLVAVFVSAAVLIREKQSFLVPKGCRLDVLFRCICGTLGMICNFYAIDKMNISDANMLNKLSPFFAIIFSMILLKEKANKIEWMAVCMAFIGALFVIKPSFEIETFYAVIGALGGLGAGMAYTFVRKAGQKGVKGMVIVFSFSMFSVLFTVPFTIAAYQPMSGKQFLCLMMAGVAATGGQFSITAAYTKAPAKEISVFDYCQVVFAAILGFLFLGQLPDQWSVIGYLIIIGTAIWKWHYQMCEKS